MQEMKGRSRYLQFSLRTLFVLTLVTGLVVMLQRERNKANSMRQLSRVRVEIYTDRASFEKRLGGAVRCIDFEDIDTSRSDVARFASTRYQQEGVVFKSSGGLFVGRTFRFPLQYPPVSGNNSFAPGPVGRNPGGNTTDLTFRAGGRPGLVAGVGMTFTDVDYPEMGASGMAVFGWDERQIGEVSGFRTADGGSTFRGIVTVDENGEVIPAISTARFVNGTGWPGIDAGDGVTLDDLVFGDPRENPVQ